MRFELNPAQHEIAMAREGRVLVSAGAGTGKTRALTERFVRAIVEPPAKGAAPIGLGEILAITYTEKAAGEIAERIRLELRARGRHEEARRLDAAWISTMHGCCARLLRRHALEAGLDPSFGIVDEVASGFLGDEALDRALRSGIAGSEEVRRLVDAYGITGVADAVVQISRALKSRGFGAAELTFEEPVSPRELRAEAVALLAEAADGFKPHAGTSKGADANLEACERACATLSGMESDDELEVALAVWQVMAGLPSKARAAAVSETADRLESARIEVAQKAAGALVAPLHEGLRRVTAEYMSHVEHIKKERGLVDFDDLQIRVRDMFAADDALRERYARHFRLVMVDEFQDTDEIQLAFVKAIAGPNLCTVGDERQSIYAFRGADVEVYRRHREEMGCAGAASVDLVENYRSHPALIAFVNRLFTSEVLFGSRATPLVASRTEDEQPLIPVGEARIRIEIVRADRGTRAHADAAEADAIAEQFDQLRAEGVSAGDMVVLVRMYRRAHVVAQALERRGFDVAIVGGSRFFELPEVWMLRSLCAVIANPFDDRALAAVLLSDLSGVTDEGVLLLARAAAENPGVRSLWDALGTARDHLGAEDARAASDLYALLADAVIRGATVPLTETLGRALEDARADVLYARGDSCARQAFANVQKFLSKAERFERSGGSGAAAFVARLAAEERYGLQETPASDVYAQSSAVRIMSIHAAKGLEFPVVALPFCGDGVRGPRGVLRTAATGTGIEAALKLPASVAEGASRGFGSTAAFDRLHERALGAGLAELKRQFYVACTRAREVLVITGCSKPDAGSTEEAASPQAWMERALSPLLGVPVGESRTVEYAEGHTLTVACRAESPMLPCEAEENLKPQLRSDCEAVSGMGRSAPREGVSGGTGPLPATADIEPHVPDRLSASDLTLYGQCPFRYWGKRVARFGEAADCSATSSANLGLAFHAIAQLDSPGEEVPDLSRLRAIARFHGLQAVGLSRLEQAVAAWVNSSVRAELHEHDVVWTEYPFAWRLPGPDGGSFDLVGTIDSWGRSGPNGLVVDYKTGTGGSADDLRARYGPQARTYAYAAFREGCEHVVVSFVRPEVLDRNGEMEEVRFTFSKEDVESIEREIGEVFGRISREVCRPLPAWDPEVCPGCALAGAACSLTPPRRGVG